MSEIIVIHSEKLIASFTSFGAETLKIEDAETGRNYLWRGDAQWWGGHSPILFPATGGLWNGTGHIDGHKCAIPKHGFAKKRDWAVEAKDESSVTFLLTPQPGDADFFPYDYALRVRYELQDKCLYAHFSVENKGADTMFFQMGGHPGLELPEFKDEEPVNGYLQLDGAPDYVVRAGEQGCIICDASGKPAHFPVPIADGLVPLCVETFANEALIFDHPIAAATLLDKHKQPVARVKSSAPAWLFWSQQNQHCPFVCCEPWYGQPDTIGFEGDISERPFIQKAASGETWEGGYSVEIL